MFNSLRLLPFFIICSFLFAHVPSGIQMKPAQVDVVDTLVGEKPYYLEIRASVRHSMGIDKDDVPLQGAFLKVFNENKIEVAILYTNKKGKCMLRLPLNRSFIVEIGKPGFVSKRLDFATKVPPEKKIVYLFPCDIDIFQDVKKLDVSVLKNPIAKINYNARETQFGYDMAYTNKINADLKTMYQQFFKLQKEEEVNKPPEDTKNKKK